MRGSTPEVSTSINLSANFIDCSSLLMPASVEKSTNASRSRLSTISLFTVF